MNETTVAAPVEGAPGTGTSAAWPDVLVVVGLTVVAALAAALGFFHLAWRWGTVPVPVSPFVLAAIGWFLCRSAFRLTGALRLAALPWAGCLVVVVVLYFAGNRNWPLPLRVVTMNYETNQATDGDWRGLLLLGALVLAAAVQLSLLWATSVSARAERMADEPWPAWSPGQGDRTPQHVTPTTSGASGDGAPEPGWILEGEAPAPREQSNGS